MLYPLTKEEALLRLAEGDQIEARFDCQPDTGITIVYHFPRADVLQLLESTQIICESGPVAQQIDFGLHIPLNHREHGEGLLFFQTRPEARVPEKVLREKEEAARIAAEAVQHALAHEYDEPAV